MREEDVEWVVNDLGELGVRINGRHFFLYKGQSLEYKEKTGNVVLHDDGTPMRVRLVGKREFGETCWPLKWIQQGHCEHRYTVNTVHHPGLSYGPPEKYEWYDLPAGDGSKHSDTAPVSEEIGTPSFEARPVRHGYLEAIMLSGNPQEWKYSEHLKLLLEEAQRQYAPICEGSAHTRSNLSSLCAALKDALVRTARALVSKGHLQRDEQGLWVVVPPKQ